MYQHRKLDTTSRGHPNVERNLNLQCSSRCSGILEHAGTGVRDLIEIPKDDAIARALDLDDTRNSVFRRGGHLWIAGNDTWRFNWIPVSILIR